MESLDRTRIDTFQTSTIDSIESDPVYNNLTALIAKIIDVRFVLVTIINNGKLSIKSSFGIDDAMASDLPFSICQKVITSESPIILEDNTKEPLFASNAFLNGDLKVKFYAGVPIKTTQGDTIGALTILDCKPRVLDQSQIDTLQLFSKQFMLHFDLLRSQKEASSYRQKVAEHYQTLSTIVDIQEDYISGESSRKTFNKLLDKILASTNSAFGFLGVIRYDELQNPYLLSRAITNIAWNKETQAFYDTYAESGMKFSNLKTLFGAAITSQQPVISNDPTNDPRSSGLPKGHPPLHSFLGLPLKKNGKMIGMIGIANRPGGYSEQIISALDPVLTTCATIINAHQAAREKEDAEHALVLSSKELQETNKKLTRSNEDLSQFAYIVSHDLQAPLRHIATYADILEEELGTNQSDTIIESLDVVTCSVTRMRQMINAILAYSRVSFDSIEKQIYSGIEIVNSALAIISEDKSTFDIDMEGLSDLYCDTGLMMQVFQNLIQNAIKYQYPSRRLKIVVKSHTQNGLTTVSVNDNGKGIDSRHHGIIFNMFKRLSSSTEVEGAGIGLSICKKIIELHDGKIWVDSELGVGSRFSFSIPSETRF
jgi:signal transduction histidine kinase